MTLLPPDLAPAPLSIEVNTAGYRVSGTLRTRFERIADMLNNLDRPHVTVDLATIREHVDPARGRRAESALVPVQEILYYIAAMPDERHSDAIVVPKKGIHGQLGIPPFRISGTIYVPESMESVSTAIATMNERFLVMTDATVECWIRPELGGSYPALAVQHRQAEVLAFDVERTDPLMDVRPGQVTDPWG